MNRTPDSRDSSHDAAAPWSREIGQIAADQSTDPRDGLPEAAAAERLRTFGPNEIGQQRSAGPWRVLLAQFADLMVGLLAVAAVISAVVGDWHDAVLIGAIVIANALIGFVQHQRAERAVVALKRLAQPKARVWRGGRLAEVAARELVPGDDLASLRRPAGAPRGYRSAAGRDEEGSAAFPVAGLIESRSCFLGNTKCFADRC